MFPSPPLTGRSTRARDSAAVASLSVADGAPQPIDPAGTAIAAFGRLSPPQATAVLVPLKRFDHAKSRLEPVAGPDQRQGLVQSMARAVFRAAEPLPLFVASDDRRVLGWASAQGARELHVPTVGLNPSVQNAVAVLLDLGFSRVIIANGDLPCAKSLLPVSASEGATLVSDRARVGTNVLAVPTAVNFRFQYGPQSLGRHIAEALRLGLHATTLRISELEFDVDTPGDLGLLTRSRGLADHC